MAAQQPVYEVAVVRVASRSLAVPAVIAAFVPPRDRVVGHDGGRASCGTGQAKGPFGERLQVFGFVSRGVDGEFAETIVSVSSGLPAAAARPVFDHDRYRMPTPARVGARNSSGLADTFATRDLARLHAIAVGGRIVGDEPGMRTPGVLQAHPARFGSQVDLGP